VSPRLLLVTGKGGVGKTTCAAAIGLAAARRGRRALVVETAGARRLPTLFGVPGKGYTPVELRPGLHTLSVTPDEAIEDYVVQQIKVRSLFKLVFRNRILGPFVDAVPGLHDAVQLGKVFDLHRATRWGRPAWDLIVVDAPATGHGLTMLASARALMELTRAGPLYDGVAEVDAVLGDPAQAGLVLVSLPEEMPVNETLDLWARLDARGRAQARLCVLNEVLGAPADPADWAAAAPALRQHSPAAAEAADLLDLRFARAAREAEARARLEQGLGLPLIALPLGPSRALDEAGLLPLAERLSAAVDLG